MIVVRECNAARAVSEKMESEIKVLVIFGNIPLLGQERGNIQVFRCLKEVGIDSLFVTRKRYGDLSIQPILDQLGLNWTTATYLGRLSRGMSIRTWMELIIDSIRGTIDFIGIIRRYKPTHIHVCNDRMIVPFIPLLWLFRLPIVYRFGDVPETHRWFFRLTWRLLIKPRIVAFVCISHFIRDKLLSLGVPQKKIFLIYNSPPERPSSSKKSGRKIKPFDGYTLLYIGQISKDKGVDVLIYAVVELCRRRSDVRLLIAGDYSWRNPFASELIDFVEKDGLSSSIEFLGYVEAIPDLLAISDVHVCPSVWEEPLGNVVVEAKQARVPSVVFPSGGLPELISHKIDGYICTSKTVEALINGIEYFLGLDPSERKKMGENASASMNRLGIQEEQFTLAWQDVYRNAI